MLPKIQPGCLYNMGPTSTIISHLIRVAIIWLLYEYASVPYEIENQFIFLPQTQVQMKHCKKGSLILIIIRPPKTSGTPMLQRMARSTEDYDGHNKINF